MAKGVQLDDHSGKARSAVVIKWINKSNTHVVESKTERHTQKSLRGVQNTSSYEAMRSPSAPVWLSLSRNWRRACLPRLFPTPVCAASASVLLCGDWGAAPSIEGLPQKRVRHKRVHSKQPACDVRPVVSCQVRPQSLISNVFHVKTGRANGPSAKSFACTCDAMRSRGEGWAPIRSTSARRAHDEPELTHWPT
jgi:hypothetical protein